MELIVLSAITVIFILLALATTINSDDQQGQIIIIQSPQQPGANFLPIIIGLIILLGLALAIINSVS